MDVPLSFSKYTVRWEIGHIQKVRIREKKLDVRGERKWESEWIRQRQHDCQVNQRCTWCAWSRAMRVSTVQAGYPSGRIQGSLGVEQVAAIITVLLKSTLSLNRGIRQHWITCPKIAWHVFREKFKNFLFNVQLLGISTILYICKLPHSHAYYICFTISLTYT